MAHADTDFLKDMSATAVSRDEVKLLDLQTALERISKLPQATIAKIEGFARGGGHEFALACDMRFAARGKAKFMQMEVGMGILPCGGGASRMARQVGLGRALEIVLGADDFDADQAEAYGTINRALDADAIGPFVEAKIKDGKRDEFEAVMKEIVAETEKESGTLNYQYYVSDDGDVLVYERFATVESAHTHVDNWDRFAEHWVAAAPATRMVHLGDLPKELRDRHATLDPLWLKPLGELQR